MKQRFYIDTSVFGGIYDLEFEEESTILFERIALGIVKCVYSDLTEKELSKAPNNVQTFFKTIKDNNKELINVTPEALKLAETYIKEGVVGNKLK